LIYSLINQVLTTDDCMQVDCGRAARPHSTTAQVTTVDCVLTGLCGRAVGF